MSDKNRTGTTEECHQLAEFACPFCTQKVVLAENAEGEGALMHVHPPCKKFMTREPEEFIADCQREMSKSLN